ncbi:integrase catalytic domain-containing protein [Trichonephila inaurata madagascariensis]|uniref:Integrase catalytic domain-containing protein n=1 Tax=Trichonephila inaurata madagascariensis TaxID=2747483 RepID=A0A8X6YP51_9ARAC|nr:integrase catalytic domain-containing protein [Trichonephila inaurata madagascariensis]
MCLHCLSDQHKISKCKSKHSCSVCGFRHNTLLHRQKGESVNASLIYSASPLQGQELNPNAEEFPGPQENTALSCISNRSKTVILSTAVVWVLNHSTGSCIQARAVLDSAYGAVVYIHCVKKDGTTTTKLIASTSHVTPIEVISIPRLELLTCLLLAQLVGKVRLSLQVHLAKVILHTDSTIAIAWTNTPANQLKTFVDNRVSKIQTLTENFEWKHIPSAQNLADIISRDVNPEELSSLTLWWNGPQHLGILEQFNEPSITSSDELYMSELKNNLISA